MPRPRSRVRFATTPGPIAGSAARPADRAGPRGIPSVESWTAAEMFLSPHVGERRRGFALLCGPGEARQSPLTAFLLATRLIEPDLALRAQIVRALAEYFELRGRDYRYLPEQRGAVVTYLRHYDRPEALALLEVQHASRAGLVDLPAEYLIRLFERIPGASDVLTRIAGDRSVLVPLRQAAVEVIGLVGFIEARSALEGLQLRIAGRRAGQLTMLFAPSDWPEDQSLLPSLTDALRLLDEVD